MDAAPSHDNLRADPVSLYNDYAHDAIIGGFSSGNCGGGSGSASSISTASFYNCGDDRVVGGGNDCGGGHTCLRLVLT